MPWQEVSISRDEIFYDQVDAAKPIEEQTPSCKPALEMNGSAARYQSISTDDAYRRHWQEVIIVLDNTMASYRHQAIIQYNYDLSLRGIMHL